MSKNYVGNVLLILLVASVATIAYEGVRAIGSPKVANARVRDELRRSDLQTISDDLKTYWVIKNSLPASLTQLATIRELDKVPAFDRNTGQAYDYHVLGTTSYQLCAVFEESQVGTGESSSSWDHPAGHACFRLEVN